ncbi:MAG: sensor histidine kinase [Alphaproteobacteria bacterium]|nr:MAG: sensor histidine kinase [Alphaproteobacteria bacterium]
MRPEGVPDRMHFSPTIADDDFRLQVLERYEPHVDSLSAPLDLLVSLFARIFDMPYGAVTLVMRDRVSFRSCFGGRFEDVSRDVGICSHTIAGPDPFIVADLADDDRFRQNPLVSGEPHLGFYAGVPLIVPEGVALGALCLFDMRARPALNREQRELLEEFGRVVSAMIVAERQAEEVRRAEARKSLGVSRRAAAADQAFQRMKSLIGDEIMTPVNAMIGFARLISQQAYGPIGNPVYQQYARHIATSGERVLRAMDEARRMEPASTTPEANDDGIATALEEMVEAALSALAGEARHAGVRLHTVGGAKIGLFVDRLHLAQMLEQLLSFCLHRVAEGGCLEISWLREEDGSACLKVVGEGALKAGSEDLAADGAVGEDPAHRATGDTLAGNLPLIARLAAGYGGSLLIPCDEPDGAMALLRFPPHRVSVRPGRVGATSTPVEGTAVGPDSSAAG